MEHYEQVHALVARGAYANARPLTLLDAASAQRARLHDNREAFVKYAYIQPSFVRDSDGSSAVQAWPAKAGYIVNRDMMILYHRVSNAHGGRYLWNQYSRTLRSYETFEVVELTGQPSEYVVDAFASGRVTLETFIGPTTGNGRPSPEAFPTRGTAIVREALQSFKDIIRDVVQEALRDQPSQTAAAVLRAQRYNTASTRCVVPHCSHRDLWEYTCACQRARHACGRCLAATQHRCPMCRQAMQVADE